MANPELIYSQITRLASVFSKRLDEAQLANLVETWNSVFENIPDEAFIHGCNEVPKTTRFFPVPNEVLALSRAYLDYQFHNKVQPEKQGTANERNVLWSKHRIAVTNKRFDEAAQIAKELKRLGVKPHLIDPIIQHDWSRHQNDAELALRASISAQLPYPLGKYSEGAHELELQEQRRALQRQRSVG